MISILNNYTVYITYITFSIRECVLVNLLSIMTMNRYTFCRKNAVTNVNNILS